MIDSLGNEDFFLFIAEIMEWLLELDTYYFELINIKGQSSWLDQIMPFWRNKLFWIPLYIFFMVFIIQNFPKKLFILLLGLGLTVAIADTMSSKVIKKNIARLRPCHESPLDVPVHLLVRCGSGYSFTSSHATNHFAIASFLFFTIGLAFKRWRWLLFIWAGTIAYGQVYVGVHYPLDVLVGSLLGALIGYLVYLLFEKQFKKENSVILQV